MTSVSNNKNRAMYSRRKFLEVVGGSIGLGMLAACAPASTPTPAAPSTTAPQSTTAPSVVTDKGQVIVCSWGGDYAKLQRAAFWDPFEKETGIKVVDTSEPDTSRIRAMVDTDNVEWDIITGDYSFFLELGEKYYTPLDYSMYRQEDLDGLYAASKTPYGVGSIYLAMVQVYRTDVFQGDNHPRDWADFWNVEKFPGPRALQGSGGRPLWLEQALMADGVAIKDIYPIDVDRAFKSADRIKPHIVKWWDAGAEASQLLTDKEVVACSHYNGRAQDLIDQGVPVAIEWNQARLSQDFWYVLAKAPNEKNAQELLAFMSRGEHQAEFSKNMAYGPTNARAFDYLSKERAALLPSSPDKMERALIDNPEWWGKNNDAVVERFATWRALKS